MTVADDIQNAKSADDVLRALNDPLRQLDILPVELIHFLPPVIHTTNEHHDSDAAAVAAAFRQKFLKRQIGLCQKALLSKRVELGPALTADEVVVLDCLFVPPRDAKTDNDGVKFEIALSAYEILSASLSAKAHWDLTRLVAKLLESLLGSYTLDSLYNYLFVEPRHVTKSEIHLATMRWSSLIDSYMRLADRIANAFGAVDRSRDIRDSLLSQSLLDRLSGATIQVLLSSNDGPIEAVQLLVANVQPASFWNRAIPVTVPVFKPLPFPAPAERLVRQRQAKNRFQTTFEDLAASVLRKHVSALLKQTAALIDDSDGRWAIAHLLHSAFGSGDTARQAINTVAIEDGQSHPDVFVMWSMQTDTDEALSDLWKVVSERWCDLSNMKDATVAHRQYLSELLLLLALRFRLRHETLSAFSRSNVFLSAVSASLSNLEPAKRFQGMLVAEIVSERTVPEGVSSLSFQDVWDGDDEPRVRAREMRQRVLSFSKPIGERWITRLDSLLRSTTAPANPKRAPTLQNLAAKNNADKQEPKVVAPKRPLIQVIDRQEGDLMPYALPPEPSSSIIEALESEDPSLYASAMPSSKESSTRRRGRIRPPVYIPELVAYLNGTQERQAEEDEKAERLEIALQTGEELVRRKRGWGSELDDNAVTLAFALLNLKDDYETDNFEKLRQAILQALVACSPRKAAPAMIEQFFSDHLTISQLVALLSSLALGAVELSTGSKDPTRSFASQQLPAALHRQLTGAEPTTIDRLTEGVMRLAVSGVKQDAEDSIPAARREKMLTVKRFKSAPSTVETATTSSFNDIAAECFVLPLINRFWTYLRDAPSSTVGPYRGGTTSTILNPLVLAQFFGTLTVLVNASRNSPYFAAVIARESLEVVMAFRHTETEVQVLAAELELLVIVLDRSVALDKGRTLIKSLPGGIEVILDLRDWANAVFEGEERRTSRGREPIGRAGRAAAAILLRLQDVATS